MSIVNEGPKDRRKAGEKNGSVPFDKARARSSNPETNSGIARTPIGGAALFGQFRSHRDPPAREVVTARLLGDPAPDRVRPTDDAEKPKIYFTFRDYHAAHGETA